MLKILAVVPALLVLGCVGYLLNPCYTACSIELLGDIERICADCSASELEECICRYKGRFDTYEVKTLYRQTTGGLTDDKNPGQPVAQYCLRREKHIPTETRIDNCVGSADDGTVQYIAFEADLCRRYFSQINRIVRKLSKKGFTFERYDVPSTYDAASELICVKAYFER
jgi:hypothetical protein